MILFINESVGPMQSGEVSRSIVEAMEKLDARENYVSMKATGMGVVSYQIDDLTEEANMIILPGIFIAICIILFLNFRKLSYIILPLVGLSIILFICFIIIEQNLTKEKHQDPQ
jgi:predicted RND superfamily exporter protein